MSQAEDDFIRVSCPQCGKRLKAPLKLAGDKIHCPKCDALVKLPPAATKNDDHEWLSLDEDILGETPIPIRKKDAEKSVARPAKTNSTIAPSATFDNDEFKLAPVNESPKKPSQTPAVRKVDAKVDMPGDTGERRLRCGLKVFQHRVAEHHVAATGHGAGSRPRLRSRCTQVHQLAGVVDRQRPTQHLVEHRVNGGVRADSERKGQRRNERDEGRPAQGSECKFEIEHVRGRSAGSRMARGSSAGYTVDNA